MSDLVPLISQLSAEVLPPGRVVTSGDDPLFWVSDDPVSVDVWWIQVAGASVVQALADRGEVSSIEHFVVAMETHANPGVRAVAANIRESS